MDGFMPLTIVEEAVVLCSGESRIMLDWLQTPDSGLVFDGIMDFVNWDSQRSEVLLCSEGSERIWREDREHLS